MDIIENEMVYSDRFYNLRLPEIKRVIGADGIEREVDAQCIRDDNCHIRKMVADHKYTPIDLNDMVTVLQTGNSAIVVEVECGGLDRVERALTLLVDRLELASCPLDQLKGLLLHFQFTAEDYRPTLEEEITIEDTLFQHVAKDCALLMGFTDDGIGKEDTLMATAIAILQS